MSESTPSLTSAVPILVTGKFEASVHFFRRLGFDTRYKDDMYAIMYRDAVELHFSEDKSLDPHDNMHECRIHVRNVDALYASFPDEAIHPHGKIADMPWGTREFAVLDPGGLCVKFVEAKAA
jgi:catechol 2,3-dioxygenase-like lactoylglutathione lyase family enzyme